MAAKTLQACQDAARAIDGAALSSGRWGIALVFFVNGLIFGTWAPQIAFVPERLEIGADTLGVAFLVMAFGAILAMQMAGRLIAKHGSANVTRISAILMCVIFVGPVLAQSLAMFVFSLFLLGIFAGTLDVAMNANGVAVETVSQRPIMSSLHGMFSAGGLVGAALGGVLLHFVAPSTHALVAVAASLGLLARSLPRLLSSDYDLGGDAASGLRFPDRELWGLGALAFLALMAEGSILDWSALLLRQEVGTSATLAAMGFASFSLAMAVSRFSGDWIRARVGATSLVIVSALLAAFGLTLALMFQWPIVVMTGFALTGLGLANLVPVLFSAAGNASPRGPGDGIAAVATMGYLGFMAGPPIIGFVAAATNLTWGLGVVAVACLVSAVISCRYMKLFDS